MNDFIRYEPIQCWHFWRKRFPRQQGLGWKLTITSDGKANPILGPTEWACGRCWNQRNVEKWNE